MPMKPLLAALAGLAALTFAAALWPTPPSGPDACETRGRLRICRFPSPYDVITFALPAGTSPEFVFQGDTSASMRDFARAGNYAVAVNGTYFAGFPPSASPAGLLVQDGKILNPLWTNDPNLTDVVSIGGETRPGMTVSANAGWTGAEAGAALEFQAGPRLLSDGTVQTGSIAASTHGASPYARTVLVWRKNPENGAPETAFLVAKKPVRLAQLAAWIRENVAGGPESWAVNLDGGPSVSLYVRDLPEAGFRDDRVLPARFFVR